MKWCVSLKADTPFVFWGICMRKWTEDACENIDATFFSGDEFLDPKALEEIEVYLGRWNRQVIVCKEIIKELEGES